MGRLFDAVASLLDVRQEVDYEAQAAIELEALAASTGDAAPGLVARAGPAEPRSCAPIPTASSCSTPRAGSRRPWRITRPASTRRGRARAFHLALAAALTRGRRGRARPVGTSTVGLTGGVFANDVLSTACQGSLRRAGLRVLVHRVVPPNDGGLALGQAAVAAAWRRSLTLLRRSTVCLGVPGRVDTVWDVDGMRMATVDFGGVRKEVCLAYVPRWRWATTRSSTSASP